MRSRKLVTRKPLVYIILCLITCFYLFINSPKELLFHSFYKVKHDFNTTTFISTRYSERNGVIRLEGHFDNNLLRDIQVLDIRNASYLTRKFLNNLSIDSRNSRGVIIRHRDVDTGYKSFQQKMLTKQPYETTKLQGDTAGGCPTFKLYTSVNKVFSSDEKVKFLDWPLFEKTRKVPHINCASIFQNNFQEIDDKNSTKKRSFVEVSPLWYIENTKHCEKYVQERGYITSSLTEEEENFPIAYSLLVFKDIQQVEALLRAIYRPQNVYCIHIDKKSSDNFTRAVHGIASCFENVFVSSKSYRVVWGEIGVLLPEIACMSDLWKHKKWKYFINLTGQEFPLRTNGELVRILKAYNGANDIEGTIKRINKARFSNAPKPPHGIRPVKGAVHIVVNRGFVDFILHNRIATDLLNWTRNVDVPDETFFSSLNHNPQLQIPGSYKGEPETDCYIKPFLARYKNWGNFIYNWPCHGHRVRNVCIFGIGDLPLLSTRREMFANKFYLQGDPDTYNCMEELIFNRTRDEYFGTLQFDTRQYESLDYIRDIV